MSKSKDLTVAQLKAAAKKLGFHVTQNANTAHVAKSLFIANKRLEQAEAIMDAADYDNSHAITVLIKHYKKKWWK